MTEEVKDEKCCDKKKKDTSKSTPIDLEPTLEEVKITPAMRRQRAIVMKRHAKKIATARKRAEKRVAGKEKLHKRSRKAAINVMRSKVAGQKGKNYGDLSHSEKSAIDKKVQSKKTTVDRIAKRLLPKIKRKESSKFSRAGKQMKITENRRFHELYTKDGKVKTDRRFKIFRKVADHDIHTVKEMFDISEATMSDTEKQQALQRLQTKQKQRFIASAMAELRKLMKGEENSRAALRGNAFQVARQYRGIEANDLIKNYKAVSEEHGAGEEGTDKLRKKYLKDTPGQKEVNEAFSALVEGQDE